tara:strand:- start:158 stop:337 length:180 start_codon:yes stop_codon:yes gene_type:complete
MYVNLYEAECLAVLPQEQKFLAESQRIEIRAPMGAEMFSTLLSTAGLVGHCIRQAEVAV